MPTFLICGKKTAACSNSMLGPESIGDWSRVGVHIPFVGSTRHSLAQACDVACCGVQHSFDLNSPPERDRGLHRDTPTGRIRCPETQQPSACWRTGSGEAQLMSPAGTLTIARAADPPLRHWQRPLGSSCQGIPRASASPGGTCAALFSDAGAGAGAGALLACGDSFVEIICRSVLALSRPTNLSSCARPVDRPSLPQHRRHPNRTAVARALHLLAVLDGVTM